MKLSIMKISKSDSCCCQMHFGNLMKISFKTRKIIIIENKNEMNFYLLF